MSRRPDTVARGQEESIRTLSFLLYPPAHESCGKEFQHAFLAVQVFFVPHVGLTLYLRHYIEVLLDIARPVEESPGRLMTALPNVRANEMQLSVVLDEVSRESSVTNLVYWDVVSQELPIYVKYYGAL